MDFNSGAPNAGGGFSIDARGVNPENQFTPLPAGDYVVQLDGFADGPTRAGDGRGIKTEMSVVTGPMADRKVFDNFTYQHPNPQTVSIAIASIKQMVIAAFGAPEAGEQVISPALLQAACGREFVVRVRITPDGKGQPRNDVVEYLTKDGGRVTQAGIAAPGATPAPATKAAAPAAWVPPAAAAPTNSPPAAAPQTAAPAWQAPAPEATAPADTAAAPAATGPFPWTPPGA